MGWWNMGKRSFFTLCAALLLSLSSCGGQGEADSSAAGSSEPAETSYSVPEQAALTQIYQKRSFPTLTRGMSLYLDDYIGFVPGTDDPAEDYYVYVMDSSSGNPIGGVVGGDGSSHEILMYRPGTLIFNVVAGDDYETFTLEVGESQDFLDLLSALADYDDNYKAVEFTYDEDGNETILAEIYRSSNYIYDATAGEGYLLSKLDDNIYTFTLASADAAELEVNRSPAGDKAAFLTYTASLQTLQETDAWAYATTFNSTPSLKRFRYLFYAGQETATKLFYALGLTHSYYTSDGTYYYPFFMYACLNAGSVELLPVLLSSSGSMTYFYPFRLSLPGEAKVSALDEYVDNYLAPEKVDTTEIRDALKACSTAMNYAINGKLTFTGEDGTVLLPNSPYLKSTSYFYTWARRVGKIKLTPTLFYDDIYHGLGASAYPGGYWSTGGKTYNYDYVSSTDSYVVTEEVIEANQDASYAHWWMYSHLQRFVTTLAVRTSWLNTSYPTYDAETGVYSFSPQYSGALSLMKGFVKLGFHPEVVSYSSSKFLQILQKNGSMDIKINYGDEGALESILITLRMTLTQEDFPGIDQDYVWTDDITISGIGTTDLSEIESQLEIPE
jgi:hypothetical protein